MSDKWLSDDELNEILGQQEEGVQEEVLEQLLSDEGEEVEVKPLVLEQFSNTENEDSEPIPGFETLSDVPLDVRVVLGSTERTIEDILDFKVDSVVKLSRMAGELVDVFVGDQPIAKGEIVVIDDKFGILINEILPPQERVKTLETKIKRQKQQREE